MVLSCGYFCCLGGVFSFNMVAEHRRSSGAMEPFVQPLLLLVILGVSMVLHESWILDSSYAAIDEDFNVDKDVVYTADGSSDCISSLNETKLDLALWYSSNAWKAVGGFSQTWDHNSESSDDSTAFMNNSNENFEGHEKMVSRGTAMNSTHRDAASSFYVPDLRATSICQTFSNLNDSHVSLRDEAVGVNTLMVWHGLFLLAMYIVEGILTCISNFVCYRSYGEITSAFVSGVIDLIRLIPFFRWKPMSLVALLLMDGASAEGLVHWVWFSLFAVFLVSQILEYADMRKQYHARLSRKLKRKSHLSQRARMCRCKAIIWLSMIYTAKSMDGQVLNQVAELARAATQAATAATAIASQFSSRGSSSMESAVKVLKAPDTFTGDDSFMNWKTNFISWIGYGDERYLKLIPTVEKMVKPPDISTYKDEDKELAHKFYAILSSYLRGRCSSLVRAECENRDGFKLWYDLMHEFHPQTKQRTLSLAQTLASYPSFSAKQSMLENILNYETLVDQYEKSSGEKYPSDLKTATLLRCAPQKIREFLQLTLRDDVTYMDMKEALLSHERITKGYSQEAILKQLSAGTHSGQETSDATPMEVDRVYEKGKGKEKGKKGGDGKGKGWWNNMWQFPGGRGRGKGKGRGNFKGKSKGKGKKGKKGGKVKGKSKNKHGGGKGSNKDACFVCGSYDHWSRDCPRKVNNVNNVYYDWDGNEVSAETIFQSHQHQPSQSVQNVQQGGSSASSTQLPTSSNASTSQRSTAASSSVRRVYDLGLDNNPFSLTRMVTSGFDHTVRCAEDADFFYDWFEGRYDIDENLCVIDEDISLSPASNTIDIDEDECLHVRVAVSEWSEPQGEKSCIILDSGSDVSLLPLSFLADSGNAAKEHNLRDCQGQKLHTKGTKDAELIVSDIGNMQAVLEQQFIVGDVTNCLLSLGQMLRKGWSISKTDECRSGLALISPDEELKVPVEYRGDSLSITAWIRCVTDDSEVCVAKSSSSSMPSEPLWVQTVFVRVQDEFDLARKSDWELSETGTPYRIQQGRRFCDPRQLWGRYWPYRSTLIRKVDSDRWELVELSVAYHELDNCGASIPECSPGLDYEVLTIMAVSPHELSYVGSLVDEQPIVGVSDIPEVEGVGDPSAAGPSEVFGEVAAPQLEGVVTPDEIVINDIVLKPTSPVKDLRAASKFLGISQAGSKTRMFERICSCHILALRRRSLELAEQRYAEEEVIPQEAYSSTRQPSERERRLHEITHLPFRKWCPFCISGKSRADYKHPVGAEEVQQREHPVVQLDVMFGPSGNSVLLLIDTWTRFVFTAPMKTKSAKTVADAISEFLGVLGYFRKVEIVSDNEPVIISGVKQAQILRSRSGLETIVQQSKSFDKGRTAVAERAIQTVRAQGRTLVNYVEHQIAATFPDSHPLHLWAILQSAWLLNRFRLHSQLGCTPFQSLFGRPYKGRVANFGQDMYGISQKKAKYKAQWVKGIWVGKDAADQDILIIENDKILKSRAVRAIGTFWSKEDLINMEVSPDYMLKIATQTKGIYPVIPPLTCLPPRSDDEAASDPPDEQGGEGLEVPEMMTVPASAKVSTEEQEGQGPRLPISSRSPFGSQSPLEQRELSHLPFSAGILPEGDDDGPVKRGLDAEDTKRDIKQPKVKSYSEKRVSFDSLESKEPKQSKTSLQSSPTFAGNIRLVTQYGDVDVYVEPDEDGFDAPHEECFLHLENELDYDDDLDKSDLQLENQGPPEMTDEEIAQLDRAASLEELDRLSNIGVISEYSDVNGEEMVLDTRLVYDWRFREGHWKRRARLVAREFRCGDASNEETFSPTSSKWIIHMLLVVALVQQLSILIMDVKDAFLTVPQRDLVIVQIPVWAQTDDMITKGIGHWKLLRCLPGQRRAALHWHEHFESTVNQLDFISFEGMVTVYKHKVKQMYITIHVDDLLVIGSNDDCNWFKEEISKCFTVKSDGPYSTDEKWESQYLKRTLICNESGIVVEPNKKYIPKLLELLKIENRRGKSLPHHAQLESYSAERVLEKEKLGADDSRIFRGGLGICLYLAQDRPDVQESVRTLSGYMGCPTIKAMAALKHLASYLKNTMDYGVMLYKCGPGDVLMDHLSQFCQVDSDSLRRARSDFELEVYSDSNWALCNVTRKSTTSFMVFLCGSLIFSACRTQASVALSSCEAELLAGTAAVGDAIQMSHILRFLVNETALENTGKVTLTLHTDSSSAKAVWQRRGSGRLKHIDTRMLWLQRMLRKQYIRLQKVPTMYNPSDLTTKKLSRAHRELLMSIIGITDDREVLKFMPPIPKISGSVMRTLMSLVSMSGLPVNEAAPMEQLTSRSWWILLAIPGLAVVAIFLWMMVGRSRSNSPETASQRRRRYRRSSMDEVSSPGEWMMENHFEPEPEEEAVRRDEEHNEPEATVSLLEQRRLIYEGRLFLMFTSLVDAQYGRWGRRHQPHFEFEADNYPTDESLTRTFRQMIVMSLCLDRGKVREVEEMLLMIENDGNNDEILAGLTSLEEYMDPDMNLDMTLQESIAWLYHRFRPRLVGPQYDKVRWAAEVFSSPEESMRVSQERALEAIEHRMEIAYVTNDQAEYEALERYRDRIGML